MKYSSIFSRRLPGTVILFSILLLVSVVVGMASVALVHYRFIPGSLPRILVNGALAGIIAVMLPTVLTVIFIKMSRHRISVKHTLFISILGAGSYSVFLMLSSILYLAFGIAVASIVILVGDASIFGWWFFINRVLLGFRRAAAPFALIQPTLNVILYIAAGRFMFRLDTPFNILLIKLYSGIFIFMIVSYILLYAFDRPIKRSLGIGGVEFFSNMLQNWLFDINAAAPFGTKVGERRDVEANAVVMKGANGVKCVLFIPDIHYGPAGGMGGSDFPYALERYIRSRYNAPSLIMHTAVTAEHNPVSASQLGTVRAALDDCMKNPKRLGTTIGFSASRYGDSSVTEMRFGGTSIVTFSRAPMVTEDIAADVSALFRKMLKSGRREAIIIDAHNSRYESAPKMELDGVRFNSTAMKEYVRAIDLLRGGGGAAARVGVGSVELYNALGMPKDIGKGNLNVVVFRSGRSKRAIIQFNSNNVLPSLRGDILSHVRKKYGLEAEVYTTDTHSVNSLEHTAENVLGRHTKYRELEPLVDRAVEAAVDDIGPVTLYHKKTVMKGFHVWGSALGDNIVRMTGQVVSQARILSPIVIISGFIIAALIIAFV